MRIETELDRLLDEADDRARRAEHRAKIGRGVFEAHKRRAAADASAHPLRRARLNFRDGLTVAELAERAAVGESTILDIEAGRQRGSDLTWTRLCRALGGIRRGTVDPSYTYTA